MLLWLLSGGAVHGLRTGDFLNDRVNNKEVGLSIFKGFFCSGTDWLDWDPEALPKWLVGDGMARVKGLSCCAGSHVLDVIGGLS